MKTLFWKIIEENRWLASTLYKKYDISPNTINKAIDTDFIKSLILSSKEKIYKALIDSKLIKEEETTLVELFSEIWANN
jgi:transcriptional regulator CtsR